MNEREFCKPRSLVERHKPNPRVCREEKGKGRLFSHTPSRFLPLSKASRPVYAAGLRSGSAVSVRLRRTRDCGLIEFSTPEETVTALSSGAADPSSSRPLSPPMPFDGPLRAGRLEKGGGPVRGTVGPLFLDLERADEALRRLTGGRAFRSGPFPSFNPHKRSVNGLKRIFQKPIGKSSGSFLTSIRIGSKNTLQKLVRLQPG